MADQKLTGKCLRYFLNHGVANLSLRPLAAAVDTSARMLVHHFGSKDELIVAVMTEVRAHFQDLLRHTEVKTRHGVGEIMFAFWQQITNRENLPYLRLLLEVQVLAVQNPNQYRRYLKITSDSWLTLIEAHLPSSKDSRIFATLCAAVIDGLLLELISTGDRSRTE